MKVIKLNGEVINIGAWDYQLTPMISKVKRTEQEIEDILKMGRNPDFDYNDDGSIVSEIKNPLPKGAIEVDEDIVEMADGGKCVKGDYAKLRVYPSIADQLDYIYHNGIEAWKTKIIQPIKDKHPKVTR